jgi:hypothetical protein
MVRNCTCIMDSHQPKPEVEVESGRGNGNGNGVSGSRGSRGSGSGGRDRTCMQVGQSRERAGAMETISVVWMAGSIYFDLDSRERAS